MKLNTFKKEIDLFERSGRSESVADVYEDKFNDNTIDYSTKENSIYDRAEVLYGNMDIKTVVPTEGKGYVIRTPRVAVDGIKWGNRNTFGDFSRFGKYNEFGHWNEFGDFSIFGEHNTFGLNSTGKGDFAIQLPLTAGTGNIHDIIRETEWNKLYWKAFLSRYEQVYGEPFPKQRFYDVINLLKQADYSPPYYA